MKVMIELDDGYERSMRQSPLLTVIGALAQALVRDSRHTPEEIVDFVAGVLDEDEGVTPPRGAQLTIVDGGKS